MACFKSKDYIWIAFAKEGIHCYPEALTDPTLKTGDAYDVSFLGHPHRHSFKFRVQIQVFHSNRDIEFIQFSRWVQSLYTAGTLSFDYKSCEMLADELAKQIGDRYPDRHLTIEVSEDGENGAVGEYTT